MCAQTTSFLLPVVETSPFSILFYQVLEYTDSNANAYKATQLTSVDVDVQTVHLTAELMPVVLTTQLVVQIEFMSSSRSQFQQSSHVCACTRSLRACNGNLEADTCSIRGNDPGVITPSTFVYFVQLRPDVQIDEVTEETNYWWSGNLWNGAAPWTRVFKSPIDGTFSKIDGQAHLDHTPITIALCQNPNDLAAPRCEVVRVLA